jgi:hypothetical protein
VLACDRPPGLSPFDEILNQSDVIGLHVPLTPETPQLPSHRSLAEIHRDAVILNNPEPYTKALNMTPALLAAFDAYYKTYSANSTRRLRSAMKLGHEIRNEGRPRGEKRFRALI